jgi:hypothetical protein
VDGEVVVRDRRLELVGEDWVTTLARREAGALWRRLETIGEHPFDPRVVRVR